jgi:hypothetical protein
MRTHGWLAGLAAALLAGCAGYGASDEVTFGEIVYTQPKAGQSFTALTRYYVDPWVNVATDDPQNPTSTALPSSVEGTLDANLQARGWTKRYDQPTGLPTDLDTVWIQATAFKGNATYYYPGYWCDYWYYYGCYYGWSYAGSYKYGTVVFEMAQVDPTPGKPQKLPVVWAAAVYGVASSPSYDIGRINDALYRAFSQSPYLAH